MVGPEELERTEDLLEFLQGFGDQLFPAVCQVDGGVVAVGNAKQDVFDLHEFDAFLGRQPDLGGLSGLFIPDILEQDLQLFFGNVVLRL